MNRSNWVGIGLTVVFHALLLTLCFSSGLKYLYPPPQEQAFLMEFPDDEPLPQQMEVGNEPRSETPDPDREVQLVKRSESPVQGTKANEAPESTVGEDGDGIEWTILNNVIDASGMGWTKAGSYVYGEGAPALTGVPVGLNVRYYDLYEDGFCGGNVGANRCRAIVWAEDQADGYEGVTLTLPDGWTYDKDNNSNPVLQAGIGTVDYTVTKKIITLDDLYLLIDGEIAYDPYEFEYDPDHYYSSSVGMERMTFYGLEVERNDWNADGHGCYNNRNEIGVYEFGGFVYLTNDPRGNYGFDETDPAVRLLTEDYVYGEGENAFVISVTGDSHGSSNVVYISYAYVLDFSYVWSITAPAD